MIHSVTSGVSLEAVCNQRKITEDVPQVLAVFFFPFLIHLYSIKYKYICKTSIIQNPYLQ